ncbi:MAG TPA: hypothetical protein PKN34_02915 [Azospira sp.]|nr:hypothetical protein [Azospira sp.]
MKSLEHAFAVYIDDNGCRHTLNAEDLSDDKIFEKAKGLTLYDASEQAILVPRDIPGKRRHFYEPNSVGGRSVSGYENGNDPAHDLRVEENLVNLLSSKRWKVGFKNGDQFQQIFDVSHYDWDIEVHRIVSKDIIIRHDLFGQSKFVGMSVFRPWVAIEVIHTHFPEEKTFSALMSLSRHIPLVVLFDVVSRRNYFLKIDPAAGTVRCSYYLYEGQVWNGEKPTDIRTALGLKATIESRLRRLDDSATLTGYPTSTSHE